MIFWSSVSGLAAAVGGSARTIITGASMVKMATTEASLFIKEIRFFIIRYPRQLFLLPNKTPPLSKKAKKYLGCRSLRVTKGLMRTSHVKPLLTAGLLDPSDNNCNPKQV